MNKRWLFSMALLVFIAPFQHICAMEAEVMEKNGMVEQQQAAAPFLERVQKHGLLSPDGLLVAKCTYLKEDRFKELCPYFVQKEEREKYGRWGYYPWLCQIAICMAADGKVVGNIFTSSTLLRAMQWQDGNQLRILLTELTGVRQLKWHDSLYALNGTFLKSGMDDRQRALNSQAKAILSTQ